MATQFPTYDDTNGFWPLIGCIPPEVAMTDYVFSNDGASRDLIIEDAVAPGVAGVNIDNFNFTPAMWVYDGTEIRMITKVSRPASEIPVVVLKIDRPFSAPVVRAAVLVTNRGFQSFSILNNGGATGKINNVDFANGQSYEANQETISKPGKQDPVCYDATGTVYKISVQNK